MRRFRGQRRAKILRKTSRRTAANARYHDVHFKSREQCRQQWHRSVAAAAASPTLMLDQPTAPPHEDPRACSAGRLSEIPVTPMTPPRPAPPPVSFVADCHRSWSDDSRILLTTRNDPSRLMPMSPLVVRCFAVPIGSDRIRQIRVRTIDMTAINNSASFGNANVLPCKNDFRASRTTRRHCSL